MGVLVNSEFADSVDVPDFQVLIHGSGSNLSVIWRESDTKNILGVSNKSFSSSGSLQVPESN
jgi:hypothetical protein